MNRVFSKFLPKIAKPVLITATVIGTGIVIHYIATLFGYTLQHVIAYAGILFAYMLVPVLITGGLIFAFGLYISDKWREAKREIEQENNQLVEIILRDD